MTDRTDEYTFHQTPVEVTEKLVPHVPHTPGDVWAEPFRGEGSFYDLFPDDVEKVWAEISQGRDFRDIAYSTVDWVVTNPPFRLETGVPGKRINAYWKIIDHLTTSGVRKGLALLGNDYCLSTLTPRRLGILKDRGWYINKIVVTNVKKWRGRYFFIILGREDNGFYCFE